MTELIVTTRLTLEEITTQCRETLITNGLLEAKDGKANLRYSEDKLNLNTFETIIATGLYHILNNKEVKTDFNYLGNNNNIKLLYNRTWYLRVIDKEKYGII